MSKRTTAPSPAPGPFARVARSLKVRIDESGRLRAAISKSSGEFFLTTEVLELLRLVAAGTTRKALRKALQESFSQTLKALPDEHELGHLIEDLRSAGVVLGSTPGVGDMQSDGFGDPWVQWAMLADEVRTRRYCEALFKVVTPQTVAIDVGAGTGLFSAACLKAGAKSVLAIEETASGHQIPAIIARLGLPARGLKVFSGNSVEARLPADANLVVSELFGNDPFQEGVLITLREIASRVDLKKTRFLPQRLEIKAEIVDLVGSPVRNRVAALARFGNAVSDAGEAVAENTTDDFYSEFLKAVRALNDFKKVSFAYALEPGDFANASAEVDLGGVRLDPPPGPHAQLEKRAPARLTRDCSAPVCMMWFRVWLDEKLSISSRPGATDACEHWSPILIPMRGEARSGDECELRARLVDEEDFLHLSVHMGGRECASR